MTYIKVYTICMRLTDFLSLDSGKCSDKAMVGISEQVQTLITYTEIL